MITEHNILNTASCLFYKYGLRSISMDDIAHQAGVSKKTIYQYFSDKEALVKATAEAFVSQNKMQLFKCAASANNAVEEVMMQVDESFTKLAHINLSFFNELQKFFPAAWDVMVKYRHRTLLPVIVSNLKRGITEGCFEEKIDVLLAADVRLQQITTALSPESFSARKYSVYELMHAFTTFYLQGISTAKGKQLINQYLNNRNEQ